MNEQMTDMNLEEVTHEEVADTPAVEETTSDTTAEAVAEEGKSRGDKKKIKRLEAELAEMQAADLF